MIPAIKKWIWKIPPITRAITIINVLGWFVTAVGVDRRWKPELCAGDFFQSFTASSIAWLVLRNLLWALPSGSTLIATFAVIILHRETSRMENRRGSIYACSIVIFLWAFSLICFVGLSFLIENPGFDICLMGPMGIAFGVKQLENAVYPREEKLFLCSPLYFPASMHMIPACLLWQVLTLVLYESLDVSVFLGTFGGIVLSAWAWSLPCKGFCPCRSRLAGWEKKECFWLSRSASYIALKDPYEPPRSTERSQSQSRLRSRTPTAGSLFSRGGSSRRIEEVSEETQLLGI